MYKEIFEVENGEVIINEHILNIPKLRAVYDAYTDPLPAFRFLRYRYDPKSPYCDAPENEKDEICLKEFPGEYTLEDDAMLEAVEWLKERYVTPSYRYYLDCKLLLEKLGEYSRSTMIESGRDGNITALLSQTKYMGKTLTEFRQVEEIIQKEIEEMQKARVRGGGEASYDEG